MDMEKLFRPNRWFVYFCGLLILVWMALQGVVNTRLTEEAKDQGRQLFTWAWPNIGYSSQTDITEAKVLRRSEADAVVEIKGRQSLSLKNPPADPGAAGDKSEMVDCGATLTFYKLNNNWILGKVELQ